MRPARRGEPVEVLLESDWLLGTLVELANDGALELRITLLVGGRVVSGRLIAGRRYFDGVASEIEAVNPSHPLADYLRKEGRAVYDSDDASPAQYVHLEDARFFEPSGTVPSSQGVYWRGRLAAVDGFMLGGLSPETTQGR